MTVSERPAGPEDDSFVYDLMLERLSQGLPLDHLTPEMRNTILEMQVRLRLDALRNRQNVSAEILLAEAQPAGCMYTSTTDDEIRLVEIVIGSNWRSKGIGAAVISELERVAAGRPIRLRVDTTNSRAIRFYERLGFRKTGGDEVQHEMELATRSTPEGDRSP